MKVLSLFSGIGAFEKSLDNLEIPYELVGYCEIDKYASASYSAIHNVPESMNLGDITKVDEKTLPKDIDLCTYGFPCQDISLAGKQKGLLQCEECNTSNSIPENYIQRLKDGEKFYCEKCGAELKQTRSGLFFEALRIIEETQPRVAIAENVKNLTSKKFKEQFNIVLDSLEMAGYINYWAVLNAKDFGIPQNRERVFIVSIRKDIDIISFKFPEGFPLEIRLKDVLEDEVDEKYYLSDKIVENLPALNCKATGIVSHQGKCFEKQSDIAGTLMARDYKGFGNQGMNCVVEPAVKQIGNLMPSKTRDNPNQGRLYDKEGLCPTLGAMQGGNRQPFITIDGDSVKVREATKQGYAEAVEGDSINLEQPNSKTRRGRVGKQTTLTTAPQQGAVVNEPVIIEGFYKNRDERIYENVSPALRSERNGLEVAESNLRIRKLTPKECFRLMGFDDADFEKAEAVNSNTQLYKQAGNSIVVPVVEYIIQALLDCGALNKENEKENQEEMELRINPYQIPEQPSFNYEELKEMLIQKASHYEAIVYNEDQVKDAKADRANLNRLKKALNDERIKREKEYMENFNVFKNQINEIIKIIDKPVAVIDQQIKAFEDQQKAEKYEKIFAFWADLLQSDKIPEAITFDHLYNEKWLNASVSLKSIQEEITEKLAQIENDLAVIEKLPSYAFEAKEVYINTLDLSKAVSESYRLAEQAEKKAAWEAEQESRKAEAEAAAIKPAETPCTPDTPCTPAPEAAPEKQWVSFQAYLTVAEAKALGQYFRDNGIQYKSIR